LGRPMAARQPTGVSWSRPRRSGASTAQAAAPTLASVSARSRRSPYRSDRITWTQVTRTVPAKPSSGVAQPCRRVPAEGLAAEIVGRMSCVPTHFPTVKDRVSICLVCGSLTPFRDN
jgi:hypothetical protein